ncbi:MAG: ribbon-helix-helix domain-containing protein [Candidatus Thorarchaeota archaeon]
MAVVYKLTYEALLEISWAHIASPGVCASPVFMKRELPCSQPTNPAQVQLNTESVLLTIILTYDTKHTQVNTNMKLVTLHIPETYVDGLEKLVESNLYPNRSEAIRIAIRDLLKRELWG